MGVGLLSSANKLCFKTDFLDVFMTWRAGAILLTESPGTPPTDTSPHSSSASLPVQPPYSSDHTVAEREIHRENVSTMPLPTCLTW